MAEQKRSEPVAKTVAKEFARIVSMGVAAGILLAWWSGHFDAPAEEPPPTVYEIETVEVPPSLVGEDGKRRFPGNVCTNIEALGLHAAVREMVASSVELGGDAREAQENILESVKFDCPEKLAELDSVIGSEGGSN